MNACPLTEYENNNSKISFDNDLWLDLVARVSGFTGLSPRKQELLKSNKVAKLVAALPFLARCPNPHRIALSHLSIYLLASSEEGKDLFLHDFSDNSDIFGRLERIMHFEGGNREIIDRGMNLLALAMLGDHHRDRFIDRKKGKYNPLNAGVWSYEKTKKELTGKIESVASPDMDEILTTGETCSIPWYH